MQLSTACPAEVLQWRVQQLPADLQRIISLQLAKCSRSAFQALFGFEPYAVQQHAAFAVLQAHFPLQHPHMQGAALERTTTYLRKGDSPPAFPLDFEESLVVPDANPYMQRVLTMDIERYGHILVCSALEGLPVEHDHGWVTPRSSSNFVWRIHSPRDVAVPFTNPTAWIPSHMRGSSSPQLLQSSSSNIQLSFKHWTIVFGHPGQKWVLAQATARLQCDKCLTQLPDYVEDSDDEFVDEELAGPPIPDDFVFIDHRY